MPKGAARPVAQAARPTPGEATRVWARIGLIGFGGPAGQIALMHRVLVEEKRWISETRFLHALNFCMLLPGPEAQQLATYVGWLLHGTRGGIVAGTLFILPGFAVILALSILYAVFRETDWLSSAFFGLKAAVLVIVIEAVVRIGRRALAGPAALTLAAAAFVGIFALHIPFPVIVIGAGLIGVAGASLAPGLFAGAGKAADDAEDAEVRRAGAEVGLGRAIRVVLTWGGLWAAPVVLAGVVLGWGTIYPALGIFFSKMAVVTFGGAYAVLAYVAEAAVAIFGWLQPGEMLDGLALAETTPGPLILVLTFVGFIAAYGDPGTLPPLVAGVVGATLVTWVTFVPCFLWIFLGAPYVERLRGNQRLSAGLAAITAAVVGVILNLAIFLSLHVLFGRVGVLSVGPFRPAWPVWSTLDPTALALFAVAAVALFRFKAGIVVTLALSSGLGLAVKLLPPI
ncbi:MAG: chromate efflux transporter [Bauldia sp.]